MAVFDATLSGSKATSYVSLARAVELVTDTPQEASWTTMSEAEQKSSLNVSCMWLETLSFGGSRCGIPSSDDPTKPQALKWPRSGVACEGLDAICELIPYRIEWAQVLLAVQLFENPGAIIPPGGGGGGGSAGTYVAEQTLGDLSIKYAAYPSGQAVADDSCSSCANPELINKFPWLTDILGCWLDEGSISTGSSRVILRVRS